MRFSPARGNARACMRAGVAGLVALALAACTSVGGGPGLFASSGNKPAKTVLTASDFVTKYCPPVMIRTGTEALTVYDRGHDAEPEFVRYQGSITKTARECNQTGDTMSIKVGVAGSVVGGPKGAAGSLAFPLRIAVIKQTSTTGKPLFSQLYKMPASLTAPVLRADYSFVQTISFKIAPDDHDLIVYVGFDEGKKG
jgi:hypothetical protein